MAKKKSNMIGTWAFVIGVAIALILGFANSLFTDAVQHWLAVGLVVIGVLVGLLNITRNETHRFLITSAILVFVSLAGAGALRMVWAPLSSAFDNLMILIIPATIVVAVKAIIELARD